MSHAKLSPSGSARWLACPGSVKMIAALNLVDKGNAAAQEGTTAHAVGESMLKRDEYDAKPYVGKHMDGGIVDEEMVEHCEAYCAYVRSLMLEDSLLMVEEKVDYSKWVLDGRGTADAIVLTGKTLHCVDLKYGKGVRVDAYQNTQAQLYALGALDALQFAFDFDTVVCHIFQPRKDNISSWELSKSELLEFGEYARERAQLAINGKAEDNLHATDKGCQWCAYAPKCPALFKLTTDTIGSDFDDLEDESNLPDARIEAIIKNAALIKKYITTVEDYAFEQVEGGKQYANLKIIAGRSSTKWSGDFEEHIEAALGEEAFVKKPISITNAKKILGAKSFTEQLAPYTTKTSGGRKLVSKDKPGKELTSVLDDF